MKAAVFDIDGTLITDSREKSRTVQTVRELADSVYRSEKYTLILLTARAETVREETIKLLQSKNIKYEKLLMRSESNFSLPDEVFKQRKLRKIQEKGFEVDFAVEDKIKVAEMWRENEISCIKLKESYPLKNKAFRYLRQLYDVAPCLLQKKFMKIYKENYKNNSTY